MRKAINDRPLGIGNTSRKEIKQKKNMCYNMKMGIIKQLKERTVLGPGLRPRPE